MIHIKFCVKCNWNFECFLKIQDTFHNYILNIINENYALPNYLSVEPLLNLLVAFFVEKTGCLSNFFSNSEFGIRVYKGKIEARIEGISLYIFLRISPRKINIFKKTKLSPRKLYEIDNTNVKKMLLNLSNILKSTTKMSKKWKKIKVVVSAVNSDVVY